jgi:DNA-binding NarL/FixJ family response regulator
VGIQVEQKSQQLSQAIRVGMQRAQQWGVHIGRPPGDETDEAFLSKPSSLRVIEALNQGLSLRKTAEKAFVSVNTVRKVKAMLEQ